MRYNTVMKEKPVYILGVCGTFMAGIAHIAQQRGFAVAGADAGIYPPMSDQLTAMGVTLHQGYSSDPMQLGVSKVIIGNAMSRENPSVEYTLNEGLPYISAPQWLAEEVLHERYVIAVSGTHGKTSTTALLTWILHYADIKAGYLIGGVAKGFEYSSDLGVAPYFVIEADEYDSAFFDKRPKFMHYRPKILLFNNLEFDHADIYDDLDAIKKQFQYVLRTVPQNGLVIHPFDDDAVQDVLARGVYSNTLSWGLGCGDWQAREVSDNGASFDVYTNDNYVATIQSPLIGMHNVKNTLAAFIAATHIGLTASQITDAIAEFPGVKRRMEYLGDINGIHIYDDFAHHPTAIKTTLLGKKSAIPKGRRLIAVLECASYTMKQGVHRAAMHDALLPADAVFIKRPDNDWGVDALAGNLAHCTISDSTEQLLGVLHDYLMSGDHVVIMSNRSFDGIHQRLMDMLG
jgi:UDP-N-acetylmuramate: L-alanyl-gamma-D-glutamyl-meso-diaminopimelate ligase